MSVQAPAKPQPVQDEQTSGEKVAHSPSFEGLAHSGFVAPYPSWLGERDEGDRLRLRLTDLLELKDLAKRLVKDDQVLLRLHAASIRRLDFSL